MSTSIDLVFLHCGEQHHCQAIVDKHFEDYWTLQYATAGAIELFYESDRHELVIEDNGGWFWPAYPGPRIRFQRARTAEYWHHRYCAFTGSRVQYWITAGLWPTGPQPAPRGGGHAALFDELITLIQSSGPWAQRRAMHTLEGLLLELAEARSLENTDAPWLTTVRQFLMDAPDFAPDYAALAKDLGMGLSTLRRKFRAATGQSLHEALLQNRADMARRYLGETDLPLKAIAQQLGYKDVYFFSRQFKAQSGVSPAAYRRSRQG